MEREKKVSFNKSGRFEIGDFGLDEEAIKKDDQRKKDCLAVVRLMSNDELDYYGLNVHDVEVTVLGPSYAYNFTDAIGRAMHYAPLSSIGVIVKGDKAAFSEEDVCRSDYAKEVICLTTCENGVIWKDAGGLRVNPCDDYVMYAPPYSISCTHGQKEHLVIVNYTRRQKELAEAKGQAPAEEEICKNEIFKPFIDENRLGEALRQTYLRFSDADGTETLESNCNNVWLAAYFYHVILKSGVGSDKIDNKSAFFRFVRTKLFPGIKGNESRTYYNHLDKLEELRIDSFSADTPFHRNFKKLLQAFKDTPYYKEKFS